MDTIENLEHIIRIELIPRIERLEASNEVIIRDLAHLAVNSIPTKKQIDFLVDRNATLLKRIIEIEETLETTDELISRHIEFHPASEDKADLSKCAITFDETTEVPQEQETDTTQDSWSVFTITADDIGQVMANHFTDTHFEADSFPEIAKNFEKLLNDHIAEDWEELMILAIEQTI